MTYRFVLFLGFVSLCQVTAQLRLELRDFDAQTLPHVRMKVLLTLDGLPDPRQARAAWEFTQNGRNTQLFAACPDSGRINSIALVLDNSGSMSGISMQGLKDAVHALVDSLRPFDEAGIYAFGDGIQLVHDFTSAKDSLHRSIDTMKAAGGTPLYDAILLALRQISSRQGRRALVIFTDGVDNASSTSFEQIRAAAAGAGIMLFTIGYGSSGVGEHMLRTLAKETGARYFRVPSATQLHGVFADIAAELMFPGCILEWEAPTCADSVRVLHLAAKVDAVTAEWDSVIAFPYRPDTLVLRIDAPPEVDPGGYAMTYIKLTPHVHTGLLLSFRFLFHFDPALLEISPLLPVTLGTITQGTRLALRMLRPGVVECTAALIEPAFPEGNLLGFRLIGLSADSSRPVILSIDSLTMEAGCPNIMRPESDTIEVCQCFRGGLPSIEAGAFVPSGKELRARVRVRTVMAPGPGTFSVRMIHDPMHLHFASVETENDASLGWSEDIPGVVLVDGWTPVIDSRDSLLFTAVYRAAPTRESLSTDLRLPDVRVYSDCCYRNLDTTFYSTVIDGYCDHLFSLKRGARLGVSIPHPAASITVFPVVIDGLAGAPSRHMTLDITGEDGRSAMTVFDGWLPAGEHMLLADLSSLAAGSYICRLFVNGTVKSRLLQVVR